MSKQYRKSDEKHPKVGFKVGHNTQNNIMIAKYKQENGNEFYIDNNVMKERESYHLGTQEKGIFNTEDPYYKYEMNTIESGNNLAENGEFFIARKPQASQTTVGTDITIAPVTYDAQVDDTNYRVILFHNETPSEIDLQQIVSGIALERSHIVSSYTIADGVLGSVRKGKHAYAQDKQESIVSRPNAENRQKLEKEFITGNKNIITLVMCGDGTKKVARVTNGKIETVDQDKAKFLAQFRGCEWAQDIFDHPVVKKKSVNFNLDKNVLRGESAGIRYDDDNKIKIGDTEHGVIVYSDPMSEDELYEMLDTAYAEKSVSGSGGQGGNKTKFTQVKKEERFSVVTVYTPRDGSEPRVAVVTQGQLTQSFPVSDLNRDQAIAWHQEFVEQLAHIRGGREYNHALTLSRLDHDILTSIRKGQALAEKKDIEGIVRGVETELDKIAKLPENAGKRGEILYKQIEAYANILHSTDTSLLTPDEKLSKDLLVSSKIEAKREEICATNNFDELKNLITQTFGEQVLKDLVSKGSVLKPSRHLAGQKVTAEALKSARDAELAALTQRSKNSNKENLLALLGGNSGEPKKFRVAKKSASQIAVPPVPKANQGEIEIDMYKTEMPKSFPPIPKAKTNEVQLDIYKSTEMPKSFPPVPKAKTNEVKVDMPTLDTITNFQMVNQNKAIEEVYKAIQSKILLNIVDENDKMQEWHSKTGGYTIENRLTQLREKNNNKGFEKY